MLQITNMLLFFFSFFPKFHTKNVAIKKKKKAILVNFTLEKE